MGTFVGIDSLASSAITPQTLGRQTLGRMPQEVDLLADIRANDLT